MKRKSKQNVGIVFGALILMLILAGTAYGSGVISAVHDESANTVSVTFDNNYASGWMIDLCTSEQNADKIGPFENSVAHLYVERTDGLQAGTQVIDLAEIWANIPTDGKYYLYVSAYTPEEDTTTEEHDSGYQGNACLAEAGKEVPQTAVNTAEANKDALSVMSNGIPTLSITLSDADTTKNNLDYIHASKDNPVSAKATLVDSANNLSDKSAVIKGRGNFTWTLDKRPYQIKFDSKTSVLGMAPSKTWVLLANHTDRALVRNNVVFDFADEMGLYNSPESEFVDLYINGEYLGNYLICEKVEIGTNRVELTDPSGILIELDNNYGAAEPYNFTTQKSGTIFTLKDSVSDDTSVEAQKAFSDMEVYINKLESLLYADDPDWDAISSMIDVDSFAQLYFVFEFSENHDVGSSSVFFYKDGASDILHAGPEWDFDLSLGNYKELEPTEDLIKNFELIKGEDTDWYVQLCRNEEFVALLNSKYSAEVEGAVNNAENNRAEATNYISGSADSNFAKWSSGVFGTPTCYYYGGRTTLSSYSEEVSYLDSWISQRADYISGAYGSEMPILKYATHVKNMGWQPSVTTGMKAGTTGQSLPLEALNLSILNATLPGTVEYSSHVQNIGWQDYVQSGTDSGTTGQSLQLEAVKIKLTDTLADNYDIYYRVHSQNYGWLGWAKNDETAGTVGKNLRAESIQIKIVKKGTTINNTANHCVPAETPEGQVSYRTHVQNIGWQGFMTNGVMSGTTGQSLRLEGIEIKTDESDLSKLGVTYQTHVQNIGWQGFVNNGEISGTTGQSLRLEGIQIKLTGTDADNYDIYYQVHAENYGWLGWAKNGESAGTEGLSLRLEAIKIVVVPKGSSAPGSTDQPFVKN